MQINSQLVPSEQLPFLLKEQSATGQVIFISQDFQTLKNLSRNLYFLGVNTTLLAPRFMPHINHNALDDYTFLKDYITSFEEQRPVTLIHGSLLAMPVPMPDLYGSLKIETGQNISITEIARKLADFGYISSATVHSAAEFALRGYIIDFATTEQYIRLEFMGNRIEAMKLFDPQTQRSLEHIHHVMIYPNKFLLPSFCEFEKFQARYQIAFQEPNKDLCTMIEHHPESCDINRYTKLLTNQTLNILELYEGNILLHNMTQEHLIGQKEIQFFEKQHNISHGVLYFTGEEVANIFEGRNISTMGTL